MTVVYANGEKGEKCSTALGNHLRWNSASLVFKISSYKVARRWVIGLQYTCLEISEECMKDFILF